MKQVTTVIVLLTMCIILCSCSDKAASSDRSLPLEIKNEITDNIISIDEAMYLIEAEYGNVDLPKGQKYRFVYLDKEIAGESEYYVFQSAISDDSGNTIRNNPDVWVATDGSHTTTEEIIGLTVENNDETELQSEEAYNDSDDRSISAEDSETEEETEIQESELLN